MSPRTSPTSPASPASSTSLSGPEAVRALPALEALAFPCALVATGGGRTLIEAGAVDEVFPLASVTKPIVAWAALVAVERGMLDLDDAAGKPAPEGATIRHLLAHASGIAFDSDAHLAEPGTRRIYSNRGIEILGQRLEEATATPLEAWIETAVLEPLGMASVMIPGSPAYSGEGSARDLAAFARELAEPRLVSPALAARACAPVLPGLDGVLPGYGRQSPNDFGLGVEVRGAKRPHWTGGANSERTFGHFGQSGSFLWVDPVAGRQAVFLGAEPFSAVHQRVWPELSDQVLALGGGPEWA
ncbi:serine hydrolase domain-containing protein [Actinomyces bowdenii]|uniref:Class A beta-lactamase-related serine hydrolase n=1 Tax=Actinomyces bowdenii TaxID=131109 RepID=A0A3P1V9M6_9ACTO|nr:serine hydrolase domain-containing protein [Actinomyces bowdenii]RRD30924.1 class A beta-lactamase-related serine hydrolase [Actinomyces bowdenii]